MSTLALILIAIVLYGFIETAILRGPLMRWRCPPITRRDGP